MTSKDKAQKKPIHPPYRKGQTLSEIIEERNFKVNAYVQAFGYSDRTGWFRKFNKLDSFGPVDIARLSFVLELPAKDIFEALYLETTGLGAEQLLTGQALEELHQKFAPAVPKKKREPKKQPG